MARDWLLERLDRETTEDEFVRHIEIIATVEDAEDRQWRAASANAVLRALDEQDGGYGRPDAQ